MSAGDSTKRVKVAEDEVKAVPVAYDNRDMSIMESGLPDRPLVAISMGSARNPTIGRNKSNKPWKKGSTRGMMNKK